MIVLDAVARRLPGALAEGSGELESFSAELGGGPEYPHYTRPAEYRGWPVPDVLLSGHHARIREWLFRTSRAAPSAEVLTGRGRAAFISPPPPAACRPLFSDASAGVSTPCRDAA